MAAQDDEDENGKVRCAYFDLDGHRKVKWFDAADLRLVRDEDEFSLDQLPAYADRLMGMAARGLVEVTSEGAERRLLANVYSACFTYLKDTGNGPFDPKPQIEDATL